MVRIVIAHQLLRRDGLSRRLLPSLTEEFPMEFRETKLAILRRCSGESAFGRCCRRSRVGEETFREQPLVFLNVLRRCLWSLLAYRSLLVRLKRFHAVYLPILALIRSRMNARVMRSFWQSSGRPPEACQ